MGSKITIDSATMMNKVFEVMEARNIFDLDLKRIKILLHEKSYIHAFIKFKNGLIKFLAHEPNMKIPIANTLDNHNYIQTNTNINLEILNNLKLKKIDIKRYPISKTLSLIGNKTSLFDTVIITANDQLVESFLKTRLVFNKYINFFSE